MPIRRCEHCGTSFTSTATRCPGCGAHAPEFRASPAPREDREVDTVVDRFITAQERPESTGTIGSRPVARSRAAEPVPVVPPPIVRTPQPQPPPEEVPTVITPALSTAEIKRLKEEFAPEIRNYDGEQTQPIVIAPGAAPSAEIRRRRSPLRGVALGVLAGLVVAAASVAALVKFGVLDLTSPGPAMPQAPPRVNARPAPAPQELPDWEPEVTTTTAASLETAGPVQPSPQPVVAKAPAPARKPPARRRVPPPQRPVAATASIEPAPPPPQPVQPGDLAILGEPGVIPPRLTADVQPRFPVRARMSGISGRVELRLLVDHRGVVENVTVEKSSGYAHLDNSAIFAARKSRYSPATKEGVPVRMWISRSYNFR